MSIAALTAGHADPLDESWCHCVVEGRLPHFVKDARPHVEAGIAPNGMPIGTT